ncbi:CRTAC1 family protein [Rhodocaloribacter sp.]
MKIRRPPTLLSHAGVLLVLLAAGCAGEPGPAPEPKGEAPWFEEVAAEAGIDFTHVRALRTRLWFPEIMSGGAGWIDYDGDGDLDLYLVQGGALDPGAPEHPGNRLFRNDDGTFTDVTDEAGVGDGGYGMGCAVGDYDGDGDLDLYVTNVGPNVLYRNDGDGTFTDVTDEAGVGHPGWGTSAAFLDYDGDDRLDLYVVNYVDWSPRQEIACFAGGNERDYCQPANYQAPATDVLYHNEGDGSFEDVTRDAGIARARGNGLGVTTGDFDGDGRLELYVTNDGNPKQLWINRGDGSFEDRALVAGSAVNRQGMAEAGMGVAAVDIDHDGDLDLFMTHLRDETNTFYLNNGGVFEDATIRTGLAAPSIRYTGFGVGFADFDLDGFLDLYVANGRVGKTLAPLGDDPYGEPNQLFRGKGNGRFEEMSPPGGTARTFIETSRAAAFGDYDDDGDVDIAVVNNGGRVRLLRNRAGDGGRWAAFHVLDASGRDAVGAMVRLTAGGRTQWRAVATAYSYQASNDPRVHFGLAGVDRIEEVLVIWPGGERESFGPFVAGKVDTLRKGHGAPAAP